MTPNVLDVEQEDEKEFDSMRDVYKNFVQIMPCLVSFIWMVLKWSRFGKVKTRIISTHPVVVFCFDCTSL